MIEAGQCDEIIIHVTDSEASPRNTINIWAWPSTMSPRQLCDTTLAQYIGTIVECTGTFYFRPVSKVHIELRRQDGNLAEASFEAYGYNYLPHYHVADMPHPFTHSSDLDLSVLNTDEPLPDNDHFVDPPIHWQRVEVWRRKYPE